MFSNSYSIIMCLEVREHSLIMGWQVAQWDAWIFLEPTPSWAQIIFITQKESKNGWSPNWHMNSFKDIPWPACTSARCVKKVTSTKWGQKLLIHQLGSKNVWLPPLKPHPLKHMYIWIQMARGFKILGSLDVGSQNIASSEWGQVTNLHLTSMLYFYSHLVNNPHTHNI